MAFNTSFNLSYLIQTATYPSSIVQRPGLTLSTTHRSDNLKVTTYPNWFKHVGVEWKVPADWGRCLFNVYQSQIEDGPFQLLNPDPINGTMLLDTSTQEYKKFDRGFYVVEAILVDRSNVSIRSEPTSWQQAQSSWVGLRALEIQRREYLLLSRFVGGKSYVFRKRAYGPRCSECWSSKLELVTKDNCKTCYGTSFEGGYWPPAPSYLQYETTPNENQKTYFGITESNQIGAWTISIPEIRPDDLVLRAGEWSLYRVDKITPTELQGNTVRQILTISQLDKGFVEYNLLNANLPDFPAPYRS